MTIKEIAAATARPEKTARKWISKASLKKTSIILKTEEAFLGKKPADYDLEETLAIIEIGLGKNAAALFRQNAQYFAEKKSLVPAPKAPVQRSRTPDKIFYGKTFEVGMELIDNMPEDIYFLDLIRELDWTVGDMDRSRNNLAIHIPGAHYKKEMIVLMWRHFCQLRGW